MSRSFGPQQDNFPLQPQPRNHTDPAVSSAWVTELGYTHDRLSETLCENKNMEIKELLLTFSISSSHLVLCSGYLEATDD